MTKEEKFRDIVASASARDVDGTVVDLYSAQIVLHVLDNLKPDNAVKFLARPVDKMVETAFRIHMKVSA